MMTQIDFQIDKEKKIIVTVPNLEKKITYFYPSTENLHKFDEATLYYINNNYSLEICKDTLDEVILSLHGALKYALSNIKSLPSNIEAGTAGYALNHMLNNIAIDDLKPFWVWSSKEHVQTLIYSSNNTIYLEIIPTYPWVYNEPKPGDRYISFEEFMKTYKPYAVEQISHEIAQIWLDECEKALRTIIDY